MNLENEENQKPETRNQKKAAARFWFLVSGFWFLTSVASFASDLTVDRRTIRLNETITITVTLDGPYAGIDRLNVPLQNLAIESGPSTESLVAFTNGVLRRQKVFRWVARPLRAGAALVGPLVIDGDDGQRETLAPVAVQIVADATAGSNDPLTILRELVVTGRDPIFVISEVEKKSVHVGEEVVVTWMLYNASVVREWRISSVPKLPDFWSEELDVRNVPPEQTIVGTTVMQRVPIRRTALYPLRSGTLTVGSLEISAEVMRRVDSGPFGIFEGTVVAVRYPSAPLSIDVRPLPEGQQVDVVGEVDLHCSEPQQRSGGPVVIDVVMRGRGNLRSARPPRFESAVDGAVEVEERGVTVTRTRETAEMTRRWSYLIFPAKEGTLAVPPLVSTLFSPSAGTRRQLRCPAATLEVAAGGRADVSSAPRNERGREVRVPKRRWIAAAVVLAVILLVIVRRSLRALRLRRAVRSMSAGETLADIRIAVDTMMAARGIEPHLLIAEGSERGDAYRAVRSLLDALERERTAPVSARREVESRLRDLVQSLR